MKLVKSREPAVLYFTWAYVNHRIMYRGSRTAVSIISSSLTRNCFQEILLILHFNDNRKVEPRGQNILNKLHKIKPKIDHFGKVSKETNPAIGPKTNQAIGNKNTGLCL